MAGGSFTSSSNSGSGMRASRYEGRATIYVILTCVVAASGGLMFGYDIGISGT
jgi:hypothetical protein